VFTATPEKSMNMRTSRAIGSGNPMARARAPGIKRHRCHRKEPGLKH
jgi:hypothetical protein